MLQNSWMYLKQRCINVEPVCVVIIIWLRIGYIRPFTTTLCIVGNSMRGSKIYYCWHTAQDMLHCDKLVRTASVVGGFVNCLSSTADVPVRLSNVFLALKGVVHLKLIF